MKRMIALLTLIVMLLSCGTAFAADGDVSPSPSPDAITVMLDGTVLNFDVPAQIIGDRTMVPMRAIFEAFGADVTWIPEDQMIMAVRGTIFVTMKIGSKRLVLQDITQSTGTVVELDVPPQIVDSRTLVPVRAIAEGLQAEVTWDGASRTVSITTSK